MISSKYIRICTDLIYIEHLQNLAPAVTGCVSTSVLLFY